MPVVKLSNDQIEQVGITVHEERQKEHAGLLQLKLRRILTAIEERFQSIMEFWQNMSEQYAEKDEEGRPKVQANGIPVWKSAEDRQAANEQWAEIADDEYEIQIDYLLSEDDIKQMNLTGPQLDALMMVSEMEADIIDDEE